MYCTYVLSEPKAPYGFQGAGKSCYLSPMISNMAETILFKISRIVEGSTQNDLAEEFLEKMKNKTL